MAITFGGVNFDGGAQPEPKTIAFKAGPDVALGGLSSAVKLSHTDQLNMLPKHAEGQGLGK